MKSKSLLSALLTIFSIACFSASLPDSTAQSQAKILIFSKTTGFRHDSIPDGIAAIRQLGQQNGFDVDATEDAGVFNETDLARYQAVVFLNTTGDILDANQQAAFEQYLRKGGGYAGVHSASDTEYDWAWYGGLVGAYFNGHPRIQPATIRIDDATHPSTSPLPANWMRNDEWYNFRFNPRGRVKVLANIDESTYEGGTMGSDHPIAWCQLYDGGRAWYTAGGHTKESYNESLFRQHLLGGIQFVAKIKDGACAALTATSAASFRADELASSSIASIFGTALTTTTESATESPLPITLAGTSVRVTQAGIARPASLFFASPTQINLLIPVGFGAGPATFTVVRSDSTAPSGVTQLHRIAPGLFSANANGRGVPAGVLLVRPTSLSDEFLSIADFDTQTNSFVPRPIDISSPDKRYFLILFGTAFRALSSTDAVSVKIGGVDAPVIYAGAQTTLAGLDQLNVEIPRSLAGRGDAEVVFTVGDKTANTLLIKIK